LSACRLEQIRRLLLRATRWHAANYAATDKMRQVGQQRSAGSGYVEAASRALGYQHRAGRRRAAARQQEIRAGRQGLRRTRMRALPYASTAYILALNKIIGENDVINAETLPKVKMPNRDGFISKYPDKQ
jgi:hypothetical protein